MQRVKVNAVELEYDVQGSGEPVVLLHGGLLADENTPLMSERALTDRYRVINYHRRGFAGSEHPPGKATIEEQGADCHALMQHLGIARAHLMGHSLGGVIAMQVAYAYPESVHTLALMEPALMGAMAKAQQGPDAQASQQKFMEGMAKVNQIYETGDKRGALQAFLETRAGESFRDVLNFLTKTGEFETAVKDADTFLQVEMPSSYRWEFSAQKASQINAPVLSILGAHSPDRAQKVGEFLVSWIPHTEKLVLAGAEHALPLMDPPGIAAALAGWFAKHPMQSAQYSIPATARKRQPMKGRVIFVLRLKPGSQEDFLQAYNGIRHEVARGVKGHLVDQVCQSPYDPLEWIITSEWETLDHFLEWEKTQEHLDLAKPLRDCFAEAKSLKYVVREETGHGSGLPAAARLGAADR